MKIKGNLDLSSNQIINVVLDKRASAPAVGVKGQLYYNETDNVVYKHNGVTWTALGGLLGIDSGYGTIIVGDSSDGYATIDVNVDNVTLDIDTAGSIRIKDEGVSTDKIKNASVTTVKIEDKAITFAKIQDVPTMTVIGRVVANSGVASAISIINDNTLAGANDTNLATAGAIKAYIDANISAIGKLRGAFNPNTSTTFPTDTNINPGDYWRVVANGEVLGLNLQIGDIITSVKKNPSPTNVNDWIFYEGNRDNASTTVTGLVMLATSDEVQAGTNNTKAITPQGLSSRTATENRTGIAKIATTTQATEGTDDTTIMTPKKVKAMLDYNMGGYTALLPSGTSVVVTHGLNTKFLIAEFFLEANGERILCDYNVTNTSSITVLFPTPEIANSIRVVIKK